ncbi:MAG TPA: protein MnhE, partial [Acidobacteria bacterium]|nr:protein MnhE [Acidobacteriota bacterium]
MQRLVVFLILFAVWLVFSGHFDALHLALGLACSALVAVLSSELLLPQTPSFRTAVTTWRVLRYLPWLLYQIVLANLHVVYLVWRPGQLRPQIVQFRTGLTSDLARVVLGNSITLTPGTITMDI